MSPSCVRNINLLLYLLQIFLEVFFIYNISRTKIQLLVHPIGCLFFYTFSLTKSCLFWRFTENSLLLSSEFLLFVSLRLNVIYPLLTFFLKTTHLPIVLKDLLVG